MTLLMHPNFIKYNKIIDKAISEDRVKSKPGQYERHHIIPKAKSIGGSNDKSNLVLLTPEEHYICHSLLPDFLEGKQKADMMHAWHAFNQFKGYSSERGLQIIGADVYMKLKKDYAEQLSIRMKGENNPSIKNGVWNKGKKLEEILTPEKTKIYKLKMREAKLGTTRSIETRKKISLSNIGKHGKGVKRSQAFRDAVKNGFTPDIKHMNNGIKGIKVKPDEIDNYLKEGYVIGRLSFPKQQIDRLKTVAIGRKHMNNGIKNVMVNPNEITIHLKEGFVFGRLMKNKKTSIEAKE